MVELEVRAGNSFAGIAKPLYGEAVIDGESYELVIGGETPSSSMVKATVDTGLKFETGIYNKAGMCSFTVLSDTEILEDVDAHVNIRGHRLFTGTVRSSKRGFGQRWRVNCYDGIADLKRTEVTQDYDRELVSEIVVNATSEAGLSAFTSIPRQRASPNFNDQPADTIMEKAAKWTDSAWWVNEFNNVILEDDIASARTEWDLEHVKDASPGKRSPPYQKVRVVGGTAVSRRGLNYRYMLSSEPVVAVAGTGTPIFHHRDSDIQTQEMAQNVANRLKKRLIQQQKGGWVEIIGRPRIRPFDSVVMPQTYGGDKYLVSEAKHTIDANDGYVTRLKLGGLVSADSSGAPTVGGET